MYILSSFELLYAKTVHVTTNILRLLYHRCAGEMNTPEK